MRIGIVTSWFERGVAYVAKEYMKQLEPTHQCFIYNRGGEREAKGDPVWDKPFVTWGKRPVIDDPSAVDLQDFARWVERTKIDCVFFNEQRSWPAVVWCARNGVLNGALVLHYREDTLPYFDCHDFVCCSSRHHYEVFRNHAQPLHISWGTDLKQFYPKATAPVHAGRVTFVHAGGMNPHRKGTDIVLEAFSALKPGSVPAHLILHTQIGLKGNIRSGIPQMEELLARKQMSLITRTVPDLADVYRMGDVCLAPTRHEGLGLTIAESLACGLPILVTDQEPVSEHADGRTVRTLAVESRFSRPDGDYWPQTRVSTQALTAAMQQIVEEYRDLPQLQKEARARAEELTDWSKNARELPAQFAQLQIVKSARKEKALAAAEEYDRQKWHRGLRAWVGYRFPNVIRVSRVLRSPSKVEVGQR